MDAAPIGMRVGTSILALQQLHKMLLVPQKPVFPGPRCTFCAFTSGWSHKQDEGECMPGLKGGLAAQLSQAVSGRGTRGARAHDKDAVHDAWRCTRAVLMLGLSVTYMHLCLYVCRYLYMHTRIYMYIRISTDIDIGINIDLRDITSGCSSRYAVFFSESLRRSGN